jgi:DNA-binding MarR family transcriptional regulator
MIDQEVLEAQSTAFGRVFVLVQHLTRLTDAMLDDWGLTTRQWLLLAIMLRAFPDHSPTLTEAAEVHGSSRQNVKQVALGLEARGFLRLAPDPLDGRAVRLMRTGKERMFDEPEGQARGFALLGEAFDGFTREEIILLRDLTVRWVDSLADQWRAQARQEDKGTRDDRAR